MRGRTSPAREDSKVKATTFRLQASAQKREDDERRDDHKLHGALLGMGPARADADHRDHDGVMVAPEIAIASTEIRTDHAMALSVPPHGRERAGDGATDADHAVTTFRSLSVTNSSAAVG